MGEQRGGTTKALALQLLRSLGIETGQTVLDFGCGSGTYAIPAAEIVGQKGRVYALDKDRNVLDELMENARKGLPSKHRENRFLGKGENWAGERVHRCCSPFRCLSFVLLP